MKNLITPIAIIVTGLLAGCSKNSASPFDPVAGGPPTAGGHERQEDYIQKPKAISIMIGGALGTSYELTYDGRELKYYKGYNFFALKNAQPEIIKPTKENWEDFLTEFKKLNHVNWRGHYKNESIHDGTYWQALIYYDAEGDIIASGSNAYPEDFAQLKIALKKLIGDREFE